MGNIEVHRKNLGRARSKCWLGKRRVVREVIINLIDHHIGLGKEGPQLVEKKFATP